MAENPMRWGEAIRAVHGVLQEPDHDDAQTLGSMVAEQLHQCGLITEPLAVAQVVDAELGRIIFERAEDERVGQHRAGYSTPARVALKLLDEGLLDGKHVWLD
jgi:hypothetical protein